MSKKIKLQDLSLSNFELQPEVKGIKGGYCYTYIIDVPQAVWFLNRYVTFLVPSRRRVCL